MFTEQSMKKSIISALVLLSCVFAGPAMADSEAVARKEMEVLASKMLTESLLLLQKSGAIYPFALLMDKDEEVSAVGYSGEAGVRPPADAYAWSLIHLIRDQTNQNSNVRVAALAKMHVVEVEGEKTPGLWILVDHIDAPAWVVFQPLIPDDQPGHYSLGQQVYQPSKERLFVLR